MSEEKTHVYKVSRHDLVFQFAVSFEEMFEFKAMASHKYTNETGVRGVEAIGFDFKNECSPSLRISPIDDSVFKELGKEAKDFNIVITVLDVALKIRRVIAVLGVEQIIEMHQSSINIKELNDMGFYRGFEVGAYIMPKISKFDLSSELIWHKGQIIYSALFEYKASSEEAFFDINFEPFSERDDEALYYIKWNGNEVSSATVADTLEVVVNENLKEQYFQLQNNKKFGPLVVRLMFSEVLREIIDHTLRYAELLDMPLEDSLHWHLQALFSLFEYDFDLLAKDMQSDDSMRQFISQEIMKISQKVAGLGSALRAQEFGGYRGM